MARQNTNFDPASKEFEAYLDFSGGHNSEVSNERLNDNEFPLMLNVDNSGRGSAKTRHGRDELPGPSGVTTGQGIFNFFRIDQTLPDVIVACDGQLFLRSRSNPTAPATKIPITDGANTDFRFQTTLPIEAAQYQEKLFVATGTKLVEVSWNGTSYAASVVTPYTPTAMEAIYIGTNGLAENPDAYIQDGVASGSVVEAVGIKPAMRNGAVNTEINMTAFINLPSGFSGTVDYKWEFKKSSETTWPTTPFKDFTAGLKIVAMTFDSPTKYDVRLTVRKTGDATAANQRSYTLSSFTVNPTADPPTMPVTGIQKCRKIMLHWDRILLSGDDTRPYQMYISDLQNPRYFPVTNTINFDFGKQEPITAVVRFQDMLVVFTRSTVQTLLGKSTDDYKRYLIHDGIGCVADRSAVVVGNNVLFLSQDGIYVLRPNPYRLETMNVGRADQLIQREISELQAGSSSACAIAHDSQYWLCFPQAKVIYRYYFERKTWVKDHSDKLNIAEFLMSADDVLNLTTDGKIYQHNKNVFTDAGSTYNMEIESKFFDLSASFNNKSLKRLYILAKHYKTYSVNLFVTVKADSSIALSPDTGKVVKDPNGWYWETTTEPNFDFNSGTIFGTWLLGESMFGDVELSVQKTAIRGKCRRVKIIISVPSSTPSEIYGFAFQFKLKKI